MNDQLLIPCQRKVASVSLAQVLIMDFKITVHIHRSHGLDMVLYSTTDDLHSGTVSTYFFFYSSDTVNSVLPLRSA